MITSGRVKWTLAASLTNILLLTIVDLLWFPPVEWIYNIGLSVMVGVMFYWMTSN